MSDTALSDTALTTPTTPELTPPTPHFRTAAVFDLVHPETGPGFAEDHPVVEDLALRALLLERLAAGLPVLLSPALMHDVRNPAAGAVVPLNFRTDGAWIWTDTIAYYLEAYGLAPEPELLAHLSAPDYRPAPADQATVDRAAAFVLSPPAQDAPVWRVG
ncbi:hypothetical protein [Streptomyces sp. WAC06614]|uniref:hypothetical protein n=1 Tax=Streptomyces sp. WAC06614 TaxID=2487416 RepID=UPI00163B74FD|nr:hypothetical protein [Streptomyces sp. WAC06614]